MGVVRKEKISISKTKYGNPISNQKFNKHIKEICKIIGIDDLVAKPSFDMMENQLKELI
jgi:hypothetical protein